jgi:hypothetical protein
VHVEVVPSRIAEGGTAALETLSVECSRVPVRVWRKPVADIARRLGFEPQLMCSAFVAEDVLAARAKLRNAPIVRVCGALGCKEIVVALGGLPVAREDRDLAVEILNAADECGVLHQLHSLLRVWLEPSRWRRESSEDALAFRTFYLAASRIALVDDGAALEASAECIAALDSVVWSRGREEVKLLKWRLDELRREALMQEWQSGKDPASLLGMLDHAMGEKMHMLVGAMVAVYGVGDELEAIVARHGSPWARAVLSRWCQGTGEGKSTGVLWE